MGRAKFIDINSDSTILLDHFLREHVVIPIAIAQHDGGVLKMLEPQE